MDIKPQARSSERPMVSVILPNYCHSRFLHQRIQSILAQSYQDFELIILEDCSPDGGASREVIEQYRKDPHISHIIYNEKNSGSTFVQWHKGFELAAGELIWIAESDDFCEPEFLATVVPVFNEYPDSAFVYTTSWRVDIDGNRIWPDGEVDGPTRHYRGEDFIAHRMVCGGLSVPNASAVVFRKEIGVSLERDYMSFKAAGDRLFWIRMAERGEVTEIQRPLNYFRQHTNKVSPQKEREGITLQEEYRINTYLREKGYVRGVERLREYEYYMRLISQTDFNTPELRAQLKELWFPSCWANAITYAMARFFLRIIGRL